MASAVALLGTSTVFALSVGEPVVQSKLGQPLDAWIPVSLESPEEYEALDSFTASLAAADVYVARSLEAPVATLGVLQLRTQTTGGQVRLHLTSQQPFVEPMSTLLIKVSLGKISILRELPLLLDLQGAAATQSVAIPDPVRVAEKPQPVAQARVRAAPIQPVTRAQLKAVEAPAAVVVAAPVAPAAPQVVSRMFQLDQRFNSYAQLAASGKAPLPALQQAAVTSGASTPALPAIEATASSPRQASSSNGILWVLGFALLLAIVISNARKKQALVDWLSRMKASLPARDIQPSPMAAPLPIRPNQKAVKATGFNLRSDDVVPEAQNLNALTSKRNSVAAPTAGVSAERQRFTQLQKQFVSDEAKQKLKLAEAYLELNRTDAAMRLMDEVERLQQSVGDRRLALVKR